MMMRTKGNIQDIYPLTPMQEGMLFHALLDPSATAYFEQATFRLKGELAVDTVKKSLDTIFSRHDILRTAFVYQDRERPLQVVLKNRRVDFHFLDLVKSGVPAEQREAAVRRFRETDFRRPFDLTRDVLMRVALFRLAPREYEFVWSHHHILMDGWCVGILIDEFVRIYRSIQTDMPHQLPPPIPYRSYIDWLGKIDRNTAGEYWKEYLHHYRTPAGIPGKKAPAGAGGEYRSEAVAVTLGPHETARLKNLAEAHRVTLNIFMQTAWGIVLGRYNGKRDVVFGAVVSGRPGEIAGIESMLGLFINTVPVRIRFREESLLSDLLRVVQEAAVDGEPYHYYPLADIQAESTLKQDLLDHIMVFENFPGAGGGAGTGLEVIRTESFSHTGFDFNVKLLPRRQFQVRFEFNRRALDRCAVQGVADQFYKILQKILAEGDLAAGALKLAAAGHRGESLLARFNDDLDNF